MKAKEKTVYVCQSCGSQSPRWMGKCPDCGQWNTLVEERIEKQKDIGSAKRKDGTEPLALHEIYTSSGNWPANPSGLCKRHCVVNTCQYDGHHR